MKLFIFYVSASVSAARGHRSTNPECDSFSLQNEEACVMNCDGNLGGCLVYCDPATNPDATQCQRDCFDSHEYCRDGNFNIKRVAHILMYY